MPQQLVTVTEPQTYLDTSVANTPSAGTVHIVAGGDNIQTHFDAAVPGDEAGGKQLLSQVMQRQCSTARPSDLARIR